MKMLIYETPQDPVLLAEYYLQNTVVYDKVRNEYFVRISNDWYRIQEHGNDIYQEILNYGIDLGKLKEMLDDWEQNKYPERFI
jgi:hypothetical protein